MSQNKQPASDDNLGAKKAKEKPISLFPLTLDETLSELLTVKPPPEGWQENKKKKHKVKK